MENEKLWLRVKEAFAYLKISKTILLRYKREGWIDIDFSDPTTHLYDVLSLNVPIDPSWPTCQICGETLPGLTKHLETAHQLTTSDYKALFPNAYVAKERVSLKEERKQHEQQKLDKRNPVPGELWLTSKEALAYLKTTSSFLNNFKKAGWINVDTSHPSIFLYDVLSLSIPVNPSWPTCQLCQKSFSKLTSHLKIEHGMLVKDYLDQFPGSKIVKTPSVESTEKARLSRVGKKHSLETRKKISVAKKGKPGQKPSEETKAKRRASLKGRPTSEKQKTAGRRMTEKAMKLREQRIAQSCETDDLILISAIKGELVFMICKNCNTSFSYDSQIFQKSRRHTKICPVCYPRQLSHGISKQELEVLEFIKSIYRGQVVTNNRTVLNGYEIDIYLPDLKIGFEYTGLYWHSVGVNGKTKEHLLEKRQMGLENNVRLYTIFESEWMNEQEATKEKIIKIINDESLIDVVDNLVHCNLRWCHDGDGTVRHLESLGFKKKNRLEPQGLTWKNEMTVYDCGYDVWSITSIK